MPPEFISAVGRIVRACSDLELLLDLFIVKLTGIDQSTYYTIIGQLALRNKIEKLKTIAEERGLSAPVGAALNDKVDEALFLRNVVAHGAYMGLTQNDGSPVFFYPRQIKFGDGSFGMQAISVPTRTLDHFANYLASQLDPIASTFGVETSLERFRKQRFAVHPKASRKP